MCSEAAASFYCCTTRIEEFINLSVRIKSTIFSLYLPYCLSVILMSVWSSLFYHLCQPGFLSVSLLARLHEHISANLPTVPVGSVLDLNSLNPDADPGILANPDPGSRYRFFMTKIHKKIVHKKI